VNRKPKPAELKESAGKYADEALSTLLELMRNSSSDPVRVAAARELLDRAHGKPKADGGSAGPNLAELIEQANLGDDEA
jgi:hypothetical protein